MNVKTEKNIKQFVVSDLTEKYNIQDITKKLFLPNGNVIDMIIDNNSFELLIHIKNKKINDKDVWQVFENINVYSIWKRKNKISGVIYCQKADDSVYQLLKELNGKINIIEVNTNNTLINKVKFTTTLSKETIETLKNIANIYNVDNINDVIEILTKKEWKIHELVNKE